MVWCKQTRLFDSCCQRHEVAVTDWWQTGFTDISHSLRLQDFSQTQASLGGEQVITGCDLLAQSLFRGLWLITSPHHVAGITLTPAALTEKALPQLLDEMRLIRETTCTNPLQLRPAEPSQDEGCRVHSTGKPDELAGFWRVRMTSKKFKCT